MVGVMEIMTWAAILIVHGGAGLIIRIKHFLKLPLLQSSLLIFIAILVGGILLSYPLGLPVDRLRRRRVAFLVVLGEMLGLFLFSLSRSTLTLAATGVAWLAPLTAWTIVTGALSKGLFPEEKRGQFAGHVTLFTVLFTMVPGLLVANSFEMPEKVTARRVAPARLGDGYGVHRFPACSVTVLCVGVGQ